MDTLNAADILALIPHREPFLFVRHAQIVSATEIKGAACWDASHPILRGHFPNRPVVPGVCQVEACAQLAGVLLAWNARQSNEAPNMFGVLGAIRQAKFQSLLLPDWPLHIVCRLRTMSQTLYLVEATGQADNKPVLTCEFVIGLRT